MTIKKLVFQSALQPDGCSCVFYETHLNILAEQSLKCLNFMSFLRFCIQGKFHEK